MTHHSTSLRARRPIAILTIATATALALAACAAPDTTVEPTVEDSPPSVHDAMMTDHGLVGLDAHEIIDNLDALAVSERPADLKVSIRPNQLVITDTAERETTLAMPDDQFYVSIAPYVNQTHDCYFHSLTTCTGEIQNSDMHVLVTDLQSGEILIEESRKTFDNGFVGLWLPRGIGASVVIELDGRSATTELSTRGEDDATCITTMQLT